MKIGKKIGKTWVLIHFTPSDCPRAKWAHELSDSEAEWYRQYSECMACGKLDAYTVKVRHG